MRTRILCVTQEDIDAAYASSPRGGRCDATSCPINFAAEREFGVTCNTQRDVIYVGTDDHRAFLPRDARDFIWDFDMKHDDRITPREFVIDGGSPEFVRTYMEE